MIGVPVPVAVVLPSIAEVSTPVYDIEANLRSSVSPDTVALTVLAPVAGLNKYHISDRMAPLVTAFALVIATLL